MSFIARNGVPPAGIVGYCCATGLGILTRDFYRHLPFARWLVVEHPQLGVDAAHLTPSCERSFESAGHGVLERWLTGLATVFSIEREYLAGLWAVAKKKGVGVVLMPNAEWFDPKDERMSLIDRFIAPTRACLMMLEQTGFGRRTTYVPCPIDTTRFAFRQRERAELFVHFRGWGGHLERKGTNIVLEAARRCPDVPFLIRGQRPLEGEWPPNARSVGPTLHPEEQYAIGQVAIQPSRWEGIGLQILEAMACGLPTIVPNAPPMNEYPADEQLLVAAGARPVMLGQPWTAWEMDVSLLTEAIRRVHGQRIHVLSRRARRKTERRSWDQLRPALVDALTL